MPEAEEIEDGFNAFGNQGAVSDNKGKSKMRELDSMVGMGYCIRNWQ